LPMSQAGVIQAIGLSGVTVPEWYLKVPCT
jgi:hypothetical protein